MEKKGRLKLAKEVENQKKATNIKTTKPKKEEKDQWEDKKGSTKKRKLSWEREEETKKTPKKRKISLIKDEGYFICFIIFLYCYFSGDTGLFVTFLKWENVKRSEINKYNNIISFKSYFTHYIIFYFSSFLFNF